MLLEPTTLPMRHAADTLSLEMHHPWACTGTSIQISSTRRIAQTGYSARWLLYTSLLTGARPVLPGRQSTSIGDPLDWIYTCA